MVNNLRTISDPNDVFSGINKSQHSSIQSVIFVWLLHWEISAITDETYDNIIRAIYDQSMEHDFSTEQIDRMRTVATMMKDPKSNKSLIESFQKTIKDLTGQVKGKTNINQDTRWDERIYYWIDKTGLEIEKLLWNIR